ncbi:MAG TPA: RNA polymerase sigma-70 factor [Puia sp.]|nr:RNA polymerase sigma-70 factor [Puia sp.]
MATIAAQRIQYLQTRIARFDDQLAYKELYTALYPSLFHFTADMLHSRPLAEEVISDVFIRLWEKRRSLEEIQSLRVYCFVMAKNFSLNLLEKQHRESTCDITYADSVAAAGPDPEQLMITEEMMRRVQQAIENLPPQCRLSFRLVRENGFKYREAAEIMGLSVKTIENQLAIAIKKINAAVRFDLQRSIPVTTSSSH